MNLQQFKNLSNIVPRTTRYSAWLTRTLQHFIDAHPELNGEIEQFINDVDEPVVFE